MELYRKITKVLEEWKNNAKNKALFVKGARQIGKTYIIDNFCQKNYKGRYEYINLVNNEAAINMLNKSTTPQEYIQAITFLTRGRFNEDTVVFIDEVQLLHDALSILKDLVQVTKARFILSGSLLGNVLNKVRLYPLGYIKDVTMYPLDFEEFLIASGYTDFHFDQLRNAYKTKTPVNSYLHNEILKCLREFLVLGGMPGVLSSYFDNKDAYTARLEIPSVLETYKYDCIQYSDKNDKLSILDVYQSISSELSKKSSRFYLTNLQKNARLRDYNNLFSWLVGAGIALTCSSVSAPVYPFEFNKQRSYFKLYHNDVGIYSIAYSDDEVLDILNGRSVIQLGILYETFVATELVAHGFDLYFYNNKKNGEVDFLLHHLNSVIPVEVKSGKDYYIHSALNNLLNMDDYEINEAIVFSNHNIEVKDKITYYPIYMTMFLVKTC